MRHTLPREFYIPRLVSGLKSKGAELVDCSGTDAAVYTYEKTKADGATSYLALAFHGKAAKPDWHYSFRTEEQRTKKIAEYLEGRKSHAAYRAEQKAKRQAPHTLKVGDILSSSWGYDQTNIDYYQVTRVPGPMSVEIRKIAANSGPEEGFMTAYCTAAKDQFVGEPMIKRANSSNCVRIASYASASPWDGKRDRYSWYA